MQIDKTKRERKTGDGEERSHKMERDEGAGDRRKRGKKKAELAAELAASKEDGRGAGSEQGTGEGVKRSQPVTELDVSAPTGSRSAGTGPFEAES